MDFARRQLEKYGWTDGKGLGKNENGISEALKPKLKRSVAGIGHDAAADFTEHWWSQLYDKAAKNVEVEDKNGKTKKIKTKDDQFKITNSTYHLKKKCDGDENQDEYSDFFVRTAILTSGGSQVENVREAESEEDVDDSSGEKEKKNVLKMTDDELFAACEGRTAHKGARHGLKALGKLARIERQEQILLAETKYNGYSHAKKLKKNKDSDLDDVVENMSLNGEGDCIGHKKKKKKRKCSFSSNIPDEPALGSMAMLDNNTGDGNKKVKKSKKKKAVESTLEPLPKEKDVEMAGTGSDGDVIKKDKKSKRKQEEHCDEFEPVVAKKKGNEIDAIETDIAETMNEIENSVQKVKKRKKKKKQK